MFPKGTVTTAVTLPEKPAMTSDKKDSTVVYMVDDTDIQVAANNDTYWRTQRAMICACAVVLTILILVAGALGAITIVLTHAGVTVASEPQLNLDRELQISNEVPQLPESTIRIKIDDGGLWPPTEPATPDLIYVDVATGNEVPKLTESTIRIKIDDGGLVPPTEPTTPDLSVTGDVTKSLPMVSFSSSDDEEESSKSASYLHGRNYISSSFPYNGYYANGQEGIPPWEQSNWVGPSHRGGSEEDLGSGDVGSGDDQEADYESGDDEPTPSLTAEPVVVSDSSSSDSSGIPFSETSSGVQLSDGMGESWSDSSESYVVSE